MLGGGSSLVKKGFCKELEFLFSFGGLLSGNGRGVKCFFFLGLVVGSGQQSGSMLLGVFIAILSTEKENYIHQSFFICTYAGE